MRNSGYKKMSAKARAFCIDNLLSDITVVTSPVTAAAAHQISTAEPQNLSNSNSTSEVSVLLALMSAWSVSFDCLARSLHNNALTV